MGSELVVTPPFELTTSGDRAHLVVQLRPSGLSPAVAEANEGDDVRWWGVGLGSRLLWAYSRLPESLSHALVPSGRRR
jgi:hypothetical protein